MSDEKKPTQRSVSTGWRETRALKQWERRTGDSVREGDRFRWTGLWTMERQP